MYKNEVPRLSKENFPAWQSLMKLHMVIIGEGEIHYIEHGYVKIPRPLTTQQMKEKQEHNHAMLEIESTLSYTNFDDIKECTNTKKIWEKLQTIYGGDTNFLRENSKILRGKFDEIRMTEGENITQYCG